MIEVAFLCGIFVLATAIAKRRGHKGPVFGGAAVLAYIAGALLGPVLIAAVTGKAYEDSERPPLLWNIFRDELYRTAFVSGLSASALVVVLPLLLPARERYAGRRPRTRVPFRLLGMLAGPAGVVILVLTRGSLLGALWGFGMFEVARSCFKLARRMRTQSGDAVLSAERRPPVLFLRSFAEDARPAARDPGWGLARLLIFHPAYWQNDSAYVSIDEFLRPDVEGALGPLVALGNPDDYLPALGAARIYRSNDSWRDSFSELAARARAVIVVGGVSDGLAWELSHIRSALSPGKVFVVTPPLAFRASDRWTDFRRVATGAGLRLPEADPGAGAVLAFGEDWQATPVVSQAKTADAYVSAIGDSLKKVIGDRRAVDAGVGAIPTS